VAINRNSSNNALIAKQHYENSPEHSAFYQASTRYLDFMEEHIGYTDEILQIKKRLFEDSKLKPEIKNKLTKKEEELEKRRKLLNNKYHKDNRDKPYFNQVMRSDEYISRRYDDLIARQEVNSEKIRVIYHQEWLERQKEKQEKLN
jgi:hypothetical protein